MQETGTGLSFCNLSLSQSAPKAWPGGRGRGQFSCSLVLSSVRRRCPDRNLTLDREPRLGMERGGGMVGRGRQESRGKHPFQLLGSLVKGGGFRSLQLTFNGDRFAQVGPSQTDSLLFPFLSELRPPAGSGSGGKAVLNPGSSGGMGCGPGGRALQGFPQLLSSRSSEQLWWGLLDRPGSERLVLWVQICLFMVPHHQHPGPATA